MGGRNYIKARYVISQVVMLNLTTTIAQAVGTKLACTYQHYYGDQEPRFATILDAGARLIIERISTSDALYHNVEHTILVTLVGQDILRGSCCANQSTLLIGSISCLPFYAMTLAMCAEFVLEMKSRARSLVKPKKGCHFRAVPATRS
jgi:hypothetical protein